MAAGAALVGAARRPGPPFGRARLEAVGHGRRQLAAAAAEVAGLGAAAAHGHGLLEAEGLLVAHGGRHDASARAADADVGQVGGRLGAVRRRRVQLGEVDVGVERRCAQLGPADAARHRQTGGANCGAADAAASAGRRSVEVRELLLLLRRQVQRRRLVGRSRKAAAGAAAPAARRQHRVRVTRV